MVEPYNFTISNPHIDANIFVMLSNAFALFPEVLNLFILAMGITVWIMSKKNSIPTIITTFILYLLYNYLFNINMFGSIVQITIASANLVFILFAVVSDMNIR
jgi:hypothetical protein